MAFFIILALLRSATPLCNSLSNADGTLSCAGVFHSTENNGGYNGLHMKDSYVWGQNDPLIKSWVPIQFCYNQQILIMSMVFCRHGFYIWQVGEMLLQNSKSFVWECLFALRQNPLNCFKPETMQLWEFSLAFLHCLSVCL